MDGTAVRLHIWCLRAAVNCFPRHRVLAELLEQGSRSNLIFPLQAAIPKAATAAVGPGSVQMELDAVRMMGMNPSHALQHPGHYYYMAARCTEARRERFLASEVCQLQLILLGAYIYRKSGRAYLRAPVLRQDMPTRGESTI